MKANEFVKKFGLDKTKFIHLRCSVEKKGLAVAGVPVDINELARLVESHDLVEKVGGLSMAKDFYEKFECVHIGLDLVSCRSLGKAIADVESCMEVS